MEGSVTGALRPLPSKRKGRGAKHRISPSDEDSGPPPSRLNGNGSNLHGNGKGNGSNHIHQNFASVNFQQHGDAISDVGQTAAVQDPGFDMPPPLARVDSRKGDPPPYAAAASPAAVYHKDRPSPLQIDPPRIPLPTREEVKSFCRRTGGEPGVYYSERNLFVPRAKYAGTAASDDQRSQSTMKTAELLVKRRKSNSEEDGGAEARSNKEGKVRLRLRGDLVGKGAGRVAELTEVRVNLKFAGARAVKLQLAEGKDHFEDEKWHVAEVKTDHQKDEWSVAVTRAAVTRRHPEVEVPQPTGRPPKSACSLTMMAQRLVHPNKDVQQEDPEMQFGQGADDKWCWFGLQVELDLEGPKEAAGGKMEVRSSRSSWEREGKGGKRLSSTTETEKATKASEGREGTLLERLDRAMMSEVVVKYLERGRGDTTTPQVKTVRFHDMVWMESEKDVAWMLPGTGSNKSNAVDLQSMAGLEGRLGSMMVFFEVPNTGWECPSSSVVGAGTMSWKKHQEKKFDFVRVERLGEGGAKTSVNPHLLRFYIERVWGLKRPKLFVSVTGAAKDFDLAEGPRQKLLKGLQELGKIEGVWMATGGSSEGIMQFVGLARALMENPVPLVGFGTWGCIRGRGQMVSELSRADDSRDESYKDVVVQHDEEYSKGNVELDQNHSHFVLVSDGTADDFGKEFDVRAQLESVVAGSENRSEEILEMLTHLKMGWKDMVVNTKEDTLSASANESIPLVLICVQGGPGTIGTCLAATQQDVPLLLVKGSGKAADVIADAVLLKFKAGHVKYVPDNSMTKPMKMLLQYLKDWCDFREFMKMETLEHMVDLAPILERLNARRKGKSSSELEGEQVNDIFKAYWGGERGLDDPLKTMAQILEIANSPRCWVFDLNDRDPGGIDFSGSLLRCIINTQGYEDEGVQVEKTPLVHVHKEMTISASILFDKLMLAVHWDRKDITELVLKNTRMQRYKNRDFQQAIDRALHRAIQFDKVAVVKALLEHGATIEQYQVTADLRRWDLIHLEEGETPENKSLKKSYQAAKLWATLLRCYKVDKKTRHVFAFITAWQPASRGTSGGVGGENSTQEQQPSQPQPRWDSDIDAGVDDTGMQRSQSSSSFLQKSFTMRRTNSFTVDVSKRLKMSQRDWFIDLQKEGRKYKGTDEEKRKTVKIRKTIPKLNELFAHVMGHDFHYEMGTKANAEHDLFLWGCLTNRVDLAMVFWEKYQRPVVSALTACVLLRRMAHRSEVDPVMRDKMHKSADHFEALAIGVQKAAQDLDLSQALEMLECPTIVWDKITCLDIAIKGRCEEFIESCARSALDRRFAGDLEPYGQCLGPLQGFKRVVLVCFLTGGLIAPYVIKFALPPKALCLRHPTQRRVMPAGYPHQPQNNDYLQTQEQQDKHQPKWLRLYREAKSGKDGLEQKLGEEQLKELWLPTFSYWERLRCFWMSPVVLYMANATIQCLIAVTESYFLTTHFVGEPRARSEIQLLEWVWLSYTVASSFEELLHAIVDGLHAYCSDMWNVVDLFAAMSFWVGFAVRVSCWSGDVDCSQGGIHSVSRRFGDGAPSREELALQCYSVSLFCLWVRLLRILSADRKLGPLVLILRSMMLDTFYFGIMWVVLWMGFSVFIFGSGIDNDTKVNGCEDSEFPASCSSGWWVIRTYFQAMGEPIIEEMSTLSSVIILMMLWVMMNLVLVNLLIAMMSNTYQAIERKSERQWMIDLYQLVKESSRFALTVPAPFNLVCILAELLFFAWHLHMGNLNKLYGEHISWRMKLRNYISRNMSTQAMLAEQKCTAQEENERQKLMAFMERARIKWREGKEANEAMGDKLENMEQRLYEMKNQVAKLHDKLEIGQHEMFGHSFNRRNSRASQPDSTSSPLDPLLFGIHNRMPNSVEAPNSGDLALGIPREI